MKTLFEKDPNYAAYLSEGMTAEQYYSIDHHYALEEVRELLEIITEHCDKTEERDPISESHVKEIRYIQARLHDIVDRIQK